MRVVGSRFFAAVAAAGLATMSTGTVWAQQDEEQQEQQNQQEQQEQEEQQQQEQQERQRQRQRQQQQDQQNQEEQQEQAREQRQRERERAERRGRAPAIPGQERGEARQRGDRERPAGLGIAMAEGRQPGDQGVQILEVYEGTPAAEAGLQTGDEIVAVDGHRISLPSDVMAVILEKSPGEQVEITILRNGRRQTVTADLTTRSRAVGDVEPQFEPEQGRGQGRAWLGLQLREAEQGEGVEVGQIFPRGPADEAGLQPGDVIVGIEGNEVTGPQDVVEALEQVQPGERIRLTVMRDGEEQQLRVRAGDEAQFRRQAMRQQRGFRGPDMQRGQDQMFREYVRRDMEMQRRLQQQIERLQRQLEQLQRQLGQTGPRGGREFGQGRGGFDEYGQDRGYGRQQRGYGQERGDYRDDYRREREFRGERDDNRRGGQDRY